MTGEELATTAPIGKGIIWSSELVKNRGLTKFIVAAPLPPLVFCFFLPFPI